MPPSNAPPTSPNPRPDPLPVSAPGKVLVAGGYLVLDRAFNGLVFGLDARIHVEIEPIRTKSGVSLSEIMVRSPQFRDAAWEYGYRLTEGEGGIAVTQLRASSLPLSSNPFIETALTYTLSYLSTHLSTALSPSSLSILASQPYYSNPGKPITSSSPFLNFDVALSSAHKTGLGSSAALVTAFTAALLSYYLPSSVFSLESEDGKRVLHNLAQVAHCAAQGKVGSGFDVASAVYGSCVYRRFTPSLLSSLPSPGTPKFATALRALVDDKENTWDVDIAKASVRMPAGLRLVMCDVDCGSQTPGMVKKVLAWREANRDVADSLWSKLQEGNEGLARELTRLASDDAQGEGRYDGLKGYIEGNRKLIREMGELSGVPIEPAQQTRLLDALTEIEGVVGGVVPGAGVTMRLFCWWRIGRR
ncbi:hypothetical protein GRF29_106g111039 [Pseudopithomyces chartarum]|uniref:phosphomevalonate kinase n=1 Tax=Pseudopithomyces chartarum TaxID=1892770 RepID=A0AAN6RFE9_9PLEO|nr:hypothetical protein GRF29_106g111039 [Pseudopithomyces chartarum]